MNKAKRRKSKRNEHRENQRARDVNGTTALTKVPALVREQAMKLLRDPHFLYRVGQKIQDLGIVNEACNRLIIFLAAIC